MTSDLDVSRETLDRLALFSDLVKKWNPTINLVSRASLVEIWSRHIVDSAQVFRVAPAGRVWADLGSGGGFPGIVAAILAREEAPEMSFVLIEGDKRKSEFLRTAVRETGVNAQVVAERIEATRRQTADVLSARAVAELQVLLGFAEQHLASSGTALFQKGVSWEKEVAAARRSWQFDLETIKSVTQAGAAILSIRNIERV